MAEKNIRARIVHKHDIAENWGKATSFIPKQGEIIVYDIDSDYNYERIKIGDGVQNVNALPFYAGSWEDLADKPFGESYSLTNVIPETTIATQDVYGMNVGSFKPAELQQFVVGEQYVITVNGDIYETTAILDANEGKLVVQDNGADFNVMISADGKSYVFNDYNGQYYDDVIIKVDKKDVVVNTIEDKYISENIARVSDVEEVRTLVGDVSVSEQIDIAISGQAAATQSEAGLMSADDKVLLDNFRYTNLGSMKDKTIADLRTALEGWLNTVHNAPNAIAIFSSSEFISLWNAEDTTTTLSSGATWTVELKTFYQNGTYALLEICNYYYKAAYYVAITNSAWTEIRKVFFDSDNIVYVGPTQPTDPNIKVWINTAEEGTGVVPVLPRVATITLPAASWTGSSAPYSQVVEITSVTSASKIDLQPTVSQIVELQNADIALMAENIDGVVTIYSFGGKPSSDMTMQVLLTEVSYV